MANYRKAYVYIPRLFEDFSGYGVSGLILLGLEGVQHYPMKWKL